MRPQHLTLSLLALIAALLPAGCADQDPSLLLTGYYFATGKATEDGSGIENCTYPNTPSSDAFVSQDVTIDLQELRDGTAGRKNAFVFGSIVENRLQTNASGGSDRLDTNSVTVKSASIRFLFDSTVVLDRAFAVTISPNGSAAVAIPLINSAAEVKQISDALASIDGLGDKGTVNVIAEITVQGTLLDGTDVESNILEFPVNLCNNCEDELQTTSACIAE